MKNIIGKKRLDFVVVACRPPRYNSGYWNLRLYSSSKEFRYFCCNDHAYRMLNIMPQPSDDIAGTLNRNCINCYVLFNFTGVTSKPSCYFYWKYEAITLNDFCNNCKICVHSILNYKN